MLNVNNGERIVTYAIEAPAGSGTVSLRGAAARTGQVGDTVIVLTYAVVLGAECAANKSQTVYVDTQNRRVVPQRDFARPVLKLSRPARSSCCEWGSFRNGQVNMSESVKEVRDSGFAEVIRTGIVLLDFWAPRCGPCRMQAPILEEVAAAVGDAAVVAKVNIDENPKAADAFFFKSIPTLILLKDGQVVQQFTGLQGKETLLSAIGQVAGVIDRGSKQ